MHSAGAFRRARALAAEHFGYTGDLMPVSHGESNAVWFAGDVVLRMARTTGPSNLIVEARLVSHLPAAVGYPDLLATGVLDGYEWIATRRLPGRNLRECWLDLDLDTQTRAVLDLWSRLEVVHETDPIGLPGLAPTPFYALDRDRATSQLSRLSTVINPGLHGQISHLLDLGFTALADTPSCLVHTDAGPANAVWDGVAAVPVDFEFACLGPEDLDVENLARSIAHGPSHLLSAFGATVHHLLVRPGAERRLLLYAVLHDMWALQGWVANWPKQRSVDTWEPMRALQAHADGAS